MIFHFPLATRSLLRVLLVATAALASGCGVDSGARKTSHPEPARETQYLSAAEARQDPDRIVCRHYGPAGSRDSEKICMTARQWQRAGDDTASVLDEAQRTTGGTDGQ